jgi:hypothetical protein
MTIPTIMIFNKGEMVFSQTGAMQKEAYVKLLDQITKERT